MKTSRIILILSLLLASLNVHAQEDKLLSLIESAWNYNDSGDFQKSVETWDLFLEEVRLTEGEDCEHFFMGMIYKAGALIKLENYQGAEKVLLAAKSPSRGVDIRLTLTYLKSLGECASKQDNKNEAYFLYKDAYDYLLKYKEYYLEENGSNYHWCWSDELCSIALEIARLYRQNGEYANAETAIREAFENMRKDNENCWKHQGAGLYYTCLCELLGIYDDVLSIAVETNDTESAIAVYDLAVNVSKMHPNLITIINWDNINYVILSLLKTDKQKAKTYINEYINLMHICLDDWYNEGMFESVEIYLISKQFEYSKVGHLCQDANDFDMAEEYYRKAKLFLEENNLKKTEDYLNVLDDISYILELKHKSN